MLIELLLNFVKNLGYTVEYETFYFTVVEETKIFTESFASLNLLRDPREGGLCLVGSAYFLCEIWRDWEEIMAGYFSTCTNFIPLLTEVSFHGLLKPIV